MAEAATCADQTRRIAAACLVVGSVCVLAARIAHGDLPTDTGEEALRYVAASPAYAIVHLGDSLGVLVWAGGLVALGASLARPDARALGRLGTVSALVGAAVHVGEFSIDGHALTTLAGAWVGAAPVERQTLEAGARLVLVALGGPSTSALVVLWGTTLPLFGLALRREGYPAGLAWLGIIGGAAIILLGSVQFVRPNVVFPGVVLYGGGTIWSRLWTLAVGLAAWRRGVASASPSE